MSGPATAAFSLAPFGAVILAAQAIKEAQAMGAEYEAVLAQTREREQQRLAQRQVQQAAAGERLAALQARVEGLERRVLRLGALCQQTPDLPLKPCGAGMAAWSAHVRALEVMLERLESEVAASAGQGVRQALASVGDSPDLEGVLALYLARRQQLQGLAPADVEVWRQTVERILARLELPRGEALPARLETLAREVILAASPARAELLANELRLQVQLLRQDQAAARQEAEQAQQWLESLPDAAPASLKNMLEEVAAGLARLDAATRQNVSELLAAASAEQQRAATAAAAVVLEQSLKDLGYQVEEVAETLFVEGGMLHFQRPGWEGYYVRLRLNAREQTLNFNVVRARQEHAADEASAEQKRLDFMAEERWCAEFPQLMATLAARGIKLDLTRLLGAGELPVQTVAPESLPRLDDAALIRRGPVPKSMTLPGKS